MKETLQCDVTISSGANKPRSSTRIWDSEATVSFIFLLILIYFLVISKSMYLLNHSNLTENCMPRGTDFTLTVFLQQTNTGHPGHSLVVILYRWRSRWFLSTFGFSDAITSEWHKLFLLMNSTLHTWKTS